MDVMTVLDAALEPFRHGFMVRAMLVGAFVCGACAALSPLIVLKGWSLVGDALSHAVLPGIVVAYLVGLPLALGAIVSGVACVLGAGLIEHGSRVKSDAALGIAFTGCLALGLVLVTAFPSDIHFMHVLLGNLLGIETSDLVQVLVLGSLALLVFALKGRDLALFCFDPGHAAAIGLPTARLRMLLLCLVAVTAVASLQAVGLVLVLAMLITPGCVGLLLSRRYRVVVAIAVGSAVLSAVAGTLVSFHLDGASGPCIVLVQSAQFVAALLFAPGNGVLRTRPTASAAAPAS